MQSYFYDYQGYINPQALMVSIDNPNYLVFEQILRVITDNVLQNVEDIYILCCAILNRISLNLPVTKFVGKLKEIEEKPKRDLIIYQVCTYIRKIKRCLFRNDYDNYAYFAKKLILFLRRCLDEDITVLYITREFLEFIDEYITKNNPYRIFLVEEFCLTMLKQEDIFSDLF